MFARTPRLLLRPGWTEDAGALHQAINDEAIIRNLARAPWPYTLADAQEFLALPHHPKIPRWLIYRRTAAAPALVGTCGFSDLPDGQVEFGYWIARDHWGLGYATEAGRAALESARSLGHRKFFACHFVDNPASGNVLLKLGFRTTGRTEPRFSKGRQSKVDAVEFELSLDSDMDSEVARPLAA
ncbi:MAG: GNAT family N-acetyltransferase [Parasphingorhabdus sp.]|uniref:GNAT family N-acetyltransferase n=1 Tax=Parasphingorhabdus sp. TaxID=2709688 RepID=UPI0032975523